MPIEKRKQSDLRKPKSKPPRANRTANKTQVSMRIDNKLYDETMQWVKAEGTFLTDAVEEALWQWIHTWKNKTHRVRPSSGPDRLTHLAKGMPPDLEQILISTAAFLIERQEGSEEGIRRFWLDHMRHYQTESKWIEQRAKRVEAISEWNQEDDGRRIAIAG